MTGDRARFEQLFRLHYADLVRYAVRRAGPDAAQEIVAETFLIAWRRLPDVPDNALPWLYAAARKVAANELRRRARAGRLDEWLTALSPASSPDHADAVAEQVRVRAALDALSERDREVLRLAEWERLNTADAATVLGCSTSAFKVRLHRARRRLAAVLGSDDAVPDVVPIRQGEQA